MDINERVENGTADYYLELKEYIREFIDTNYPLTLDDFRAMSKGEETENIINRQKVYRILNEAMEENLSNIANQNTQIIEDANQGDYTAYSMRDYNDDIFEIQQKMLEKLWNEQHPEDQLINDVVEQGEKIEIRSEEISEANREINQAERDFINEQQAPQQDRGIDIGE